MVPRKYFIGGLIVSLAGALYFGVKSVPERTEYQLRLERKSTELRSQLSQISPDQIDRINFGSNLESCLATFKQYQDLKNSAPSNQSSESSLYSSISCLLFLASGAIGVALLPKPKKLKLGKD